MSRMCGVRPCGMKNGLFNPFFQGYDSEQILPEVDVFGDTFTGANGTSVGGRTTVTGDTWTIQTGALTFENNALHNPSNTVGIATFNKGWADVSMKADLSLLQAGEEMGFVFRYMDASNYWRATLLLGGNGFKIVRVVAAVETTMAFAPQTNNGQLELELIGDVVTVYCQGRVIKYTGVNALNPVSTVHGVYMKKPSTDANNPTRGNLDTLVAYSQADVEPASEVHPVIITNLSHYQTLQRSGSTANILIEGKILSNGSPHSIEASFNGSSYTTIATGRNQSFSGTLKSQSQGQGNLSVRFVDDTNKVMTLNYIGIGDVFISAGQSNASGLLTNNQVYNHATIRASMFNNAYKWGNLLDPTDNVVAQVDTVSIGSPTPTGSYWPLLATSFMADQSVPVTIIPCSAGGTSISQWQMNTSDPDDRTTLFGSMLHRALLQPNGIKAVLMHQGESDVVTGSVTPPATYESLMNQFVTDVFTHLGVKTVISKIHKWDGAPTTSQTDVDALHVAIDNVIAGNSNALLGADFDNPTRVTAGLHFTSNAEGSDAASRLWVRLEALFYP